MVPPESLAFGFKNMGNEAQGLQRAFGIKQKNELLPRKYSEHS